MSTTRMRGSRTRPTEPAAPAPRTFQTWGERWKELTPEQQEGHRVALERKAERSATLAGLGELALEEVHEGNRLEAETRAELARLEAEVADQTRVDEDALIDAAAALEAAGDIAGAQAALEGADVAPSGGARIGDSAVEVIRGAPGKSMLEKLYQDGQPSDDKPPEGTPPAA